MTDVAQSVEYLVDLFLSDDPDLEDVHKDAPFMGEGCVEVHDGDAIEDNEFEEMDQDFLKKKIGRDFKHSGDDFNKKYETVKHRSLHDDVKKLFDDQINKAGGSPDEFWPKFKGLMDDAVKDTGIDDAQKVLAAVLVSVKGLGYLGSAVRTLTLRYIGEKHLDNDFKKIRIRNESHPSLD